MAYGRDDTADRVSFYLPYSGQAEKAGPMKEEEEEEEEEEALVGDAKGLSGRLSCGNDGTGDTVGGCGSDGIEVVSVLEVEDLQAHESPVL
ncbi:hypothetical protein GW17_00012964 [Ensete ventricosum]|nr:hypothetical protein GW17_00012964 [Ensete ventricosum]